MPATPEPLALFRALFTLLVAWAATCLAGCGDRVDGGTLAGGPPPSPEIPPGLTLRLTAADLPDGRSSLRFGVAPTFGTEHARGDFEPIAAHLAQTLGVPVELVVADDYEDLIARVTSGAVDLAHIPPLAYVLARRQRPDLRLLASQLAYGATSYSAFLVVRADDPATSLTDLVGRRIAWVDPRSTSGFLFAWAALADNGLDPDTAFRESRFTGSHRAAIDALRRGEVDAAATASGMLGAALREAGESAVDLRILFKAGRIPYDALCASPSLPASGAEKIRWAFVALDTTTAEGRRVLGRSEGVSGWVPAEDDAYDAVREVLAQVEARRGHPIDAPTPSPSPDDERPTGVVAP